MCASKFGRIVSKETRKKIGLANKGFKHSEETKIIIGLKGKGRKLSEETRKRMSLSKKGHRGYMLGKKHTEEAKRKQGESHKGNKNWNWIKDRTLLKTNEKKHLDVKYKEWMLKVKNRDGWKCRISNDNCSGRLEAHHILGWKSYPGLRYDINNGITLCVAHHPRSRKKEAELLLYFQKLVASGN